MPNQNQPTSHQIESVYGLLLQNVVRFAHSFQIDEHVVRDAIQDLIVSELEHGGNRQIQTTPQQYYSGALRYKLLSAKSRLRKNVEFSDHGDSDVIDSRSDVLGSWDEEQQIRVNSWLKKLPSEDRDILLCYLHYNGKRYSQELASTFELSSAAIRQRVSRCIKQLRKIASEQGIENIEDFFGES